jgi:hypothetical protein
VSQHPTEARTVIHKWGPVLQGHQVQLAELVLFCLSRTVGDGTGTIESAIEYFDAISGVAMEVRPPELRGPVYLSLLQNLVETARYSSDFWGWEENPESEDDFYMFR